MCSFTRGSSIGDRVQIMQNLKLRLDGYADLHCKYNGGSVSSYDCVKIDFIVSVFIYICSLFFLLFLIFLLLPLLRLLFLLQYKIRIRRHASWRPSGRFPRHFQHICEAPGTPFRRCHCTAWRHFRFELVFPPSLMWRHLLGLWRHTYRENITWTFDPRESLLPANHCYFGTLPPGSGHTVKRAALKV